ncbi:MAG: Uma2 family endonuclease, partial [Planctomycetota bacterium]
LRLPSGRSREPDQTLLLDGDDPRRTNACWFAADLCIEVVSPDDPDRDYVEKRADYAAAGVSEYWIVDPRSRTPNDDRGRTIHVLTLEDGAYQERRFEEGDTASGHLLEGFSLDVTACLSGA